MASQKKESMPSELRIMSWNINDMRDKLHGDKLNVSDFVEVLLGSTIFGLQETKKEVTLVNYRCHNKNRETSRSGGVCIGVHRSIEKYTTYVETSDEDFVAVRLSKELTGHCREILVINVYDSPDNSSYKLKLFKNGVHPGKTLDRLLDFIAHQQDCDLYLMGDFNARTGRTNYMPRDLDWEDKSLQVTLIDNARASHDLVLNDRGQNFLDMIAGCNLTILNGSCLGDIFGDPTCYRYNGSSVVDYAVTSQSIKDLVNTFVIMEMNIFSDHRPILCTIRRSTTVKVRADISSNYIDAPIRRKWDSLTSPDSLKRALIAPEISEKITELGLTLVKSTNQVDDLNNGIADIFNRANELMNPKPTTGRKNQKVRKRQKRQKEPWYDAECIDAKRKLRRLCTSYGKQPANDSIRKDYYSSKKCYKALLTGKKSAFIRNLSSQVLEEKTISWEVVKKLKSINPEKATLDLYDMQSFYDFFKNLYSNENSLRTNSLDQEIPMRIPGLTEELNCPIKEDELEKCIKALKNGKAAGMDMIPNEYLKHSTPQIKFIILKLLNGCLDTGHYPWNTTVVSPLHKKGSIHDPDNYRAISIGSNLGKLFSSILLRRLLDFRKRHCPDTDNQLGFREGAQTVDHLFTLNTCIEKYVKKQRGRLYACFIDYRKAFDSICRDALLYKLTTLRIDGKFLNCLTHMYRNSTCRLKIAKKLSETFDIKQGTEQGHPLSPELFKIFIHELSSNLNGLDSVEVPILNSTRISHLLWADDLVLLSLDKEGLQRMIDTLRSYCQEWGLVVNLTKTAIMVYNVMGKLLNESREFRYGMLEIPSTKTYCYLGVTLTLSGSFSKTQILMRQKGLRAYFSLKKISNIRYIAKKAMFKLFDALVLPVVGYGCEIWLPSTNIIRLMGADDNYDSTTTITKIAQDHMERLHISFLKWTLEVPKRTSNAPVWGDTGRHPLGIVLTKQLVNYYNKLMKLHDEDKDSFLRHAFAEQKALNLPWYATIHGLTCKLDPMSHGSPYAYPNATLCRGRAQSWFSALWNKCRHQNRKLDFYNTTKSALGYERYLDWLPAYSSRIVSRFRMSAHKLNVETGRYGNLRGDESNRCCDTCCDRDNIQLMQHLPGTNSFVREDERHMLLDCHRYSAARKNVHIDVINALIRDPREAFNGDKEIVSELGRFLKNIWEDRFPQQKKKKKSS